MHSDEYWERRAIENADRRTKDTEEFLQYLTTVYNKTYSRITKTIREWYNRYASENDMTMAEAKKQLKAKELEEFKWTVEEYIDKATNDSETWAKELQRVSDRVHISRLEALRYQIHTELGITSESAVKSVSDHLGRMYNEEYYRSVFDVFQGTGIGRSFQQMDTRKVQIALERPWAYPSDNFSGRIWSNNAKLINTLDNELTQMVITGEKVDNVVKRVSTKLDSSLSNTSRLVQTEEAHISTLARKEAHKELDIEKYTFVCTLDERTCPVCGTMDKKTFNESDRKEGINSAPLHPWCRCTDMPYYDDMETGTRTARDGEGKTYRVPENITYEEWKNGLRVKEGRMIPKEPTVKPKVEPPKSDVRKILEKNKVKYLDVEKLPKKLNNNQIVNRLGGGDMTGGSCSSLALAYIGNMNQLDVLDFRGGKSLDVFSSMSTIKDLTKLNGVRSVVGEEFNQFTNAKNLLKTMESDKQYYLAVGRHASIVRNSSIYGYQYLELQSRHINGWNNLDENMLKLRFGCQKSKTFMGEKYKTSGVLIDIESLYDNEEFRKILGYINTATDKQKKGVLGDVK